MSDPGAEGLPPPDGGPPPHLEMNGPDLFVWMEDPAGILDACDPDPALACLTAKEPPGLVPWQPAANPVWPVSEPFIEPSSVNLNYYPI